MELADLKAFLAIVEHNGYRRAAEALYVSQPSLTRRVARLEQELKVTLLERGPQGCRPTRNGMNLASGARRVLAAVEETRASAAGTWSEQITLSCTTTAAGTYLSDFLTSWIPAHPGIRVQMVEDTPEANRRRLTQHVADAALLTAPIEAEFDSLPVTRFEVQALLPPGHRLARERRPLTVEDLAGEPLLISGPNFLSGRLLYSACRVAGVTPSVAFECTAGSTLTAMAEAGLGIAILSSAWGRPDTRLATRSLSGADGRPMGFDIRIAWSRDRPMNPALFEFVNDFSRHTSGLRAA